MYAKASWFSPAHDFQRWRIAKGKLKGWYCVHCMCSQIQKPMVGAFAILHKTRKDVGVMNRIMIPTGKAANVFSMSKWLNILRTGNLMLAEDALHNVAVLLCEIRAMIVRDNNVAAQVFRAFGVCTEFLQSGPCPMLYVL